MNMLAFMEFMNMHDTSSRNSCTCTTRTGMSDSQGIQGSHENYDMDEGHDMCGLKP